MTQEDKQLLLKDLCARLPYNVICKCYHTEFDEWDGKPFVAIYNETLRNIDANGAFLAGGFSYEIDEIKPYLRTMSSMTEEESKEISILYGIKDILSIKIKDEYIEVVVDDGVCSTEIRTIWYDEIISSIEIFDLLNVHHFDYRGLIPKGLAIEVTKENNQYEEINL